MKSANAVGLAQAITSAILILLLVYQQADCVGLLHHQNTARLTTFGNQNTASKHNSTAQHKPSKSQWIVIQRHFHIKNVGRIDTVYLMLKSINKN